MSSGGNFLSEELSKKTSIFGLRLWVIIGIGVGTSIVLILFVLSVWLSSRKKPSGRRLPEKLPSIMIPAVSKEIEVDHIRSPSSGRKDPNGNINNEEEARPPPQRLRSILGMEKSGYNQGWDSGQKVNSPGSNLITTVEGGGGGENVVNNNNSNHDSKFSMDKRSTASADTRSGESVTPSPVLSSCAVPEVSHLGWGHWYTLRELEVATNYFSDSQVLGEGGYGIVYQGCLPDGTMIAVKNLLNNRGQAEKEFRVEVEAIGRVRHKNLVRLIGYCAEGSHRMLVYEYVDNGNLDQWIHGPLCEEKALTWETRMKIVLGTAKGLAYLHEGLEPKVVHRDVKSSNILLDAQWNPKVSDFGLAKLLGAGKSHVTTRVMGTFGYVAPEYANTGLLNERSDVYSFGVLLMELITGREPVDYARPPGEVNLVDWLKLMVGSRRSDEVADPRLEVKPTPRALKRALLVALRCVDPDSIKRPKMGQIVHMLEADDYPFRDEHRSVRGGTLRVKESPKLPPLPGDTSFRAAPPHTHTIKDSLARKQDPKVDGIEIDAETLAGHNSRVKKYEV